MHANIHERAECRHVRDGTLEHHAGAHVLEVRDGLGEAGGAEATARVQAGAAQLGEDVLDRIHAGGAFVRARLSIAVLHVVGGIQPGERVATVRGTQGAGNPVSAVACLRVGNNAARERVGFRVHGGGVQRLFTAADANKSCRLAEGFRPQSRHVQQLPTVREGAVFGAVGDDAFGGCGTHARHVCKQLHGGAVEVHAHGVHAVFDGVVEGAAQGCGRHVVLVLAHADGLRVDFDELGERVLQAAGNGDGAAYGHVVVGQLGGGEDGGGVDGGTRLRNGHLLGRLYTLLAQGANQFAGEFVGFAACGAVANGDEFHAVLAAGGGELAQCFCPLVARGVRVDGAHAQRLTGAVDYGVFHAVAQARVQAEGGLVSGGCGEQNIAQVGGEHLGRVLCGGVE